MINRYAILRELGRGMHGKVKLAYDTLSSTSSEHNTDGTGSEGGLYAIKIITMGMQRTRSRRLKRPGAGAGGGHLRQRSAIVQSSSFSQQPQFLAPRIQDLESGFASLQRPSSQHLRPSDETEDGGDGGLDSMKHGLDQRTTRFMSTLHQKIETEIAIMKKCVHPCIVRLHEVIHNPLKDKFYLVLEYVDGGELKWRHNAFGEGEMDACLPLVPLRLIKQYFLDIVNGLDYRMHLFASLSSTNQVLL